MSEDYHGKQQQPIWIWIADYEQDPVKLARHQRKRQEIEKQLSAIALPPDVFQRLRCHDYPGQTFPEKISRLMDFYDQRFSNNRSRAARR